MRTFIVSKTVDFSSQDDYFIDSVAVVDFQFGLTWGTKQYIFTINEVQFNDSLLNPFNSETDK